jgi:SAM-dependent methyltransferase
MSDKVSWEEAVAWLVRQPDQQELVRGSYFDPPLSAAAERYWSSEEWQAVRTWLPSKKGNALDVGAGNGITTFALVKEGWTVTAIEPDNSSTIGAAAIEDLMDSTGFRATVLREFGERIPVESDSMNLVIARQVLHHARDLQQLCREIERVLKPGGTLITLRDHVIADENDLQRFLTIHPLHALYGGEFAYTVSAYRTALTKAGFEIIRVIRPFDNVVNYAPNSRDGLRRIIADRAKPPFTRRLWRRALASERVLDIVLAALSRVDRTPGRLYSFICRKHEGAQLL